jgi:hypothetical protein
LSLTRRTSAAIRCQPITASLGQLSAKPTYLLALDDTTGLPQAARWRCRHRNPGVPPMIGYGVVSSSCSVAMRQASTWIAAAP